jgi:branched-chain amino acid transport system substrate-binding protein
MKNLAITLLILSLTLAACGGSAACNDPLGCVTVPAGKPLTIAAMLTLSGSNAPLGTDALRGVELAIADRGQVANREVTLIQEDELCSPEGGQAAAERLAQNADVIGVIGATCSGASASAAKVLTEAGLPLISPSSTAASLTAEGPHQAGFLRTIYNDTSQASAVAKFAYAALGARTMAVIHDGAPYSQGLAEEACAEFKGYGGKCVAQYQITSGGSPLGALNHIKLFNPEVLYYPLYTVDGVAVTERAAEAGLPDVALIGSDGLLSADFASQANSEAQGMYISGPSKLKIDPSFEEKYKARYNEKPIASYAPHAYDAAMILFNAIEKVAKNSGGRLVIPRQALRDALLATRDHQGVSGVITCSPLGDCAFPNIVIYQVEALEFKPIYP